MLNLSIAFLLLAMGMYVCIRVIDLLIARFGWFPNSKNKNSGIYLPSDFDLEIHGFTGSITDCNVEAACDGFLENAEGIIHTVANGIEGL